MTKDEATYSVSTVRRLRRRNLPPAMNGPRAVYDLVRPLVKDAGREHFYVLILNTRNRVLAVELVSVGSLNASIVHPREVYAPAMALGAASIVISHNHPSGETDPSDDDLAITKRLVDAGNILGIQLLDHVIVANGSFLSMKEQDLL